MNFGQAIEALKQGKCISREGWNGKGMFVCKQVPSVISNAIIGKMQSLPESAKKILAEHESINYQNQMIIVKKDGTIDSWVASSSDTFAEDWKIIE